MAAGDRRRTAERPATACGVDTGECSGGHPRCDCVGNHLGGSGAHGANFSSYDKAYGTLGAFLIWVWMANTAIFVGVEPDSEIEREPRPERRSAWSSGSKLSFHCAKNDATRCGARESGFRQGERAAPQRGDEADRAGHGEELLSAAMTVRIWCATAPPCLDENEQRVRLPPSAVISL